MNSPRQEGRVPPYDQTAESAVLGSILLDNGVMAEVRAILSPEDLYVESHRRIFDAICELADRGDPIDAVTLGSRMQETGEIEKVGGVMVLAKLTDCVATSAHADRYAAIVKEKAAVRRMIHAAQEIVAHGFAQPQDVNRFMADARESIVEASARLVRGADRLRPLDAELKEIWREVSEHIEPRGVIKTGIDCIDRVTGGLFPGELNLLAARPGMGKSALALNIAQNVVSQGHRVFYWSLEETREVLAGRSLARYGDLDAQDIRMRDIPADRFSDLLEAVNKLCGRNLLVDASSGLSSHAICQRVTLAHARQNIDMFILDHLLEIREKGETKTAQVTAAVEGVRDMLKELHIPGLVLHQLNRDVEHRPDKRPLLGDLKSSGKTEEASRAVWYLYRRGYYENEPDAPDTELNIAKCNQGRLGRVCLHANLSRMYFRGWDRMNDGPFPGDPPIESTQNKQSSKWRGGTYDAY